jgi:hypothetical protein
MVHSEKRVIEVREICLSDLTEAKRSQACRIARDILCHLKSYSGSLTTLELKDEGSG